MDIRKSILLKETIFTEIGKKAAKPIHRVAALVVTAWGCPSSPTPPEFITAGPSVARGTTVAAALSSGFGGERDVPHLPSLGAAHRCGMIAPVLEAEHEQRRR